MRVLHRRGRYIRELNPQRVDHEEGAVLYMLVAVARSEGAAIVERYFLATDSPIIRAVYRKRQPRSGSLARVNQAFLHLSG